MKLDPKDLVAVAAFVLAVVNFVRTSKVSDRQYTLQFTQDVSKWVADILETFMIVRSIKDGQHDDQSAYQALSQAYRKLGVSVDQGFLLFSGKEHDVQRQAQMFYLNLRRDVLALRKSTKPLEEFSRTKYTRMRREFVREVQKINGFSERFSFMTREGKLTDIGLKLQNRRRPAGFNSL
jgi:hypothetical protein